MAERPKVSAEQALANIADAMVEDILATSDEEILAELREDGIDVHKVRRLVDDAIRRAKAQMGEKDGAA